MTETTCPYCSGRCTTELQSVGSATIETYKALPPPDLTNLREVYEKYKHLNTVLCDERIGLLSLESNIRYDLWQAVKELLEQEDKP